jgi:hypothetical protein
MGDLLLHGNRGTWRPPALQSVWLLTLWGRVRHSATCSALNHVSGKTRSPDFTLHKLGQLVTRNGMPVVQTGVDTVMPQLSGKLFDTLLVGFEREGALPLKTLLEGR